MDRNREFFLRFCWCRDWGVMGKSSVWICSVIICFHRSLGVFLCQISGWIRLQLLLSFYWFTLLFLFVWIICCDPFVHSFCFLLFLVFLATKSSFSKRQRKKGLCSVPLVIFVFRLYRLSTSIMHWWLKFQSIFYSVMLGFWFSYSFERSTYSEISGSTLILNSSEHFITYYALHLLVPWIWNYRLHFSTFAFEEYYFEFFKVG